MRQANEAKNSEPGAVVETAYEYELDEYQEVSL